MPWVLAVNLLTARKEPLVVGLGAACTTAVTMLVSCRVRPRPLEQALQPERNHGSCCSGGIRASNNNTVASLRSYTEIGPGGAACGRGFELAPVTSACAGAAREL